MMKKYPEHQHRILDWHNVPEKEFFMYARVFNMAAKKLAMMTELDSGPSAKFAVCPVVFMYRHALELQLKALVLGDGSNFLATKPDRMSVFKTQSVSWLSQFVCQIVTALKWEDEFKCEGIETLADFKAVVEDINSIDPGPQAFRYPTNTEARDSADSNSTFSVRDFAQRMDALLVLLDRTADALAATWDERSEAAALDAVLFGGKDIEPTIQ
jgi:hypothetical protein